MEADDASPASATRRRVWGCIMYELNIQGGRSAVCLMTIKQGNRGEKREKKTRQKKEKKVVVVLMVERDKDWG